MEDFPHDRETLGLEMLEGLGGVTVKVRGSGQPLQSSSEEATSQLLCAHLRTVPFSDSPSPPTSRKAKL